MGIIITQFEDTPNPNAMKCWLDRPVSERPQSFRSAEAAAEHPWVGRLFDEAGITNVLLCGEWMTVNKPASARWPAVKKKVQRVLTEVEPVG